MRGRKPKPIELRVLHGQAAERARASVPRPRRVLPRCPDYVPEGPGRDEWKRLARELYDAGLLTAVDRNALAQYCIVYVRWLEAEAIVKEKGPIVKTAAGNWIQNPFLAVANRALEQMMKLQAEFGMTPSSRTRVKAEIKPNGREAPETQRKPQGNTGETGDPRKALA